MKWIRTKSFMLFLIVIFSAFIITSDLTYSQGGGYYVNKGSMKPPTRSWVETILIPALLLTGLIVYIVVSNDDDKDEDKPSDNDVESKYGEKAEPAVTDTSLIKSLD